MIKKLKSDYVVPSHCDEFFSPILNEKIKKIKMLLIQTINVNNVTADGLTLEV